MILGWVLGGAQTLLAVAMVAAGGMKAVGHDRVTEEFDRFGYSDSFMRVTGAVELTASAALLAGLLRPTLAVAGGVLVLGVMTGALYTHVRVDDPFSEAAPPVVLLLLAVVVTAGVATTAGLLPG